MQRLNCSLIKYNEQILLVIHNYKKTTFIAFEDECENFTTLYRASVPLGSAHCRTGAETGYNKNVPLIKQLADCNCHCIVQLSGTEGVAVMQFVADGLAN